MNNDHNNFPSVEFPPTENLDLLNALMGRPGPEPEVRDPLLVLEGVVEEHFGSASCPDVNGWCTCRDAEEEAENALIHFEHLQWQDGEVRKFYEELRQLVFLAVLLVKPDDAKSAGWIEAIQAVVTDLGRILEDESEEDA